MSYIRNLKILKNIKLNLIEINNLKNNLSTGIMDKKLLNKQFYKIKSLSIWKWLMNWKNNQLKKQNELIKI